MRDSLKSFYNHLASQTLPPKYAASGETGAVRTNARKEEAAKAPANIGKAASVIPAQGG